VNVLLRFLSHTEYKVIDEVLLAVGNILSDVDYKSLGAYSAKETLAGVNRILSRNFLQPSTIRLCLLLTSTITRGKTSEEMNFFGTNNELYRKIIGLITHENGQVVTSCVHTIMSIISSEPELVLRTITENKVIYDKMLELLISKSNKTNISEIFEMIFGRANNQFYEEQVSRGILSVFTQFLKDNIDNENEEFFRILNCVLHLSRSTINVIKAITNQTDLMILVIRGANELREDYNIRIVLYILLNIVYYGDFQICVNIPWENYFITILNVLRNLKFDYDILLKKLAFDVLEKLLRVLHKLDITRKYEIINGSARVIQELYELNGGNQLQCLFNGLLTC